MMYRFLFDSTQTAAGHAGKIRCRPVQIRTMPLRFILACLVVLLCSCSGSDTPPDTGSVSFSIQLPEDTAPAATAAALYKQSPITCDHYGVSRVEARVLDENGTELAFGGPWDCSAGRGSITGIQQGTGRTLIVDLSDGDGRVILSGTVTDITVTAGQTTPVGVIELELVNPDEYLTWYRDADGDTYGDPVGSTQGFSQPEGYVSDNTDCDDTDAGVHPGAIEICGDGIDQNCDGTDLPCPTTWFRDADGDSYGNPAVSTEAVTQPPGYVSDNTDCDDTDAGVHPGATEICGDGIDQDCNGIDPPCPTTWYRDADGDSYGNPAVSTEAVTQPAGYVRNNTDCDDGNAGVHPGATEICGDGIDQNCDGIDPPCLTTWYRDADGDGYGNPASSVQAVERPDGYVSDNTDCNDSDATVHPGAAEICGDGIDQDCSGSDLPCPPTWYRDSDDDSYGNPADSTQAATQPAGYVSNNTDCDDGDAAVYPGAAEIECDGIDQDCDGEDTCPPPMAFMQLAADGETRVYVDQDNGRTGNTGRSWDQAVPTIQEALDIADEDDELWIKRGVYSLPVQLEVTRGVTLYGGFDGTEEDLDERDVSGNVTCVDGNGIVRCISISAPAGRVVIDGLSIVNGHSSSGSGGGIYSQGEAASLTVVTCTLRNNSALEGGGISTMNDTSLLRVIGCLFENNAAADDRSGGGILSSSASTEIAGCTFTGNRAGRGGGISCAGPDACIVNCLFTENSCDTTLSDTGGGAVEIRSGSNSSITNCTITGNTASLGGGIYTSDSTVMVTNSIIWNNTSAMGGDDIDGSASFLNVDYCDLQHLAWGENCLSLEPGFVDPLNHDFHLLQDSPCIDRGTDLAPCLPLSDFEGDPRVIGGAADLGIDEFMN